MGQCPICGEMGCLRKLAPYGRWAISLFPYDKRWVLVARFLCRKTKQTVSYLPLELAPYQPYTIASMLQVLWLCGKANRPGRPQRVLSALLDAVQGTDAVTESLLRCWLVLILIGFHRAFPGLDRGECFSGNGRRKTFCGRLALVSAYFGFCQVRGPPSLETDILLLLDARSAGGTTFLFGISSQDRRQM